MHFFLTGATGFLGSYLAEDLIEAGHEVTALVRAGSDTGRLRDVLPRLRVVHGDLSNIDEIQEHLRAISFDGVAHLAWRGVGNTDRNHPLQARNISDAVELFAAAADIGIKVFVGAGSQAEYGPYSRAINEDDLPKPTTLYGKAKLAAGTMVEQLARDRGVRFAWMRIFSTYGPKDADTWLIPSTIRSLKDGERVSLTACEQRWGFLHAVDAAAAFRLALTNPNARGMYNLGSPEAPSLRTTVTALRNLVNPAAELGFGDIPYRPDQVMVLQADTSRLAELGWKPTIPLEQGLRETAAWYVENQRI